MEKRLITDDEAISMASSLSDNLYYADNFSRSSFAVFCKKLPKPIRVSLNTSTFKSSNFASICLTFDDFKSICIIFDNPSFNPFLNWILKVQFKYWNLSEIHSFLFSFYKS